MLRTVEPLKKLNPWTREPDKISYSFRVHFVSSNNKAQQALCGSKKRGGISGLIIKKEFKREDRMEIVTRPETLSITFLFRPFVCHGWPNVAVPSQMAIACKFNWSFHPSFSNHFTRPPCSGEILWEGRGGKKMEREREREYIALNTSITRAIPTLELRSVFNETDIMGRDKPK